MSIKRTICIYDQCGESSLSYFVLKGDYSHLDGIYINGSDEEKEDELHSLLYAKNRVKVKMFTTFPYDVFEKYPVKEVKVIVVGFIH